jgi:hypothetical protein
MFYSASLFLAVASVRLIDQPCNPLSGVLAVVEAGLDPGIRLETDYALEKPSPKNTTAGFSSGRFTHKILFHTALTGHQQHAVRITRKPVPASHQNWGQAVNEVL